MKLRTEGLTWQEIDGEIVLLDLHSSSYLTTNATGAFLARQLTEDRTADELADALAAEYDLDPDLARRDTDAFVTSLAERDLLVGR